MASHEASFQPMHTAIRIVLILTDLAEACLSDNDDLASKCDETVATMLRAIGLKNVSLMREIAFVCGSRDISPPAFPLIGLPMLGWSPAADGLMLTRGHPFRPQTVGSIILLKKRTH